MDTYWTRMDVKLVSVTQANVGIFIPRTTVSLE